MAGVGLTIYLTNAEAVSAFSEGGHPYHSPNARLFPRFRQHESCLTAVEGTRRAHDAHAATIHGHAVF